MTSAAAIAALLVLKIETLPPALAHSAAFVSVLVGALSLFGGSHRWALKPWLVAIQVVLAGPVLLSYAFGVVLSEALATYSGPFELAFIGLAAAIAGATLDEGLASTQMIRRHTDHGRSIPRAFFGLHSKRRRGRALTLDDMMKNEGDRS